MKTLAASLLATTSSLAVQTPSDPETADTCKTNPETCEPIIVADFRISVARLAAASDGQVVRRIEAADAPDFRIDDLLGRLPGFGLFRRANSRTAHPTTQGLQLRGVGANGAGRALVMLDGVPLNDPFGGWVYWSSLDAADIGDIFVRKGGGAGAFGAQALSGTVDMRSASPWIGHGRARAEYGDDNSYRLYGSAGSSWDSGAIRVSLGRFETDGDYLLAEDQRGLVDVRAAGSVTRAGLLAEQQLGASNLRLSARYFEEDRVNGLSQAVNTTEALDLSAALTAPIGEADFELVGYYRTRDFANVFAAARDDRTTERAVLDQFDVPAWGAGVLARVQFDGLEVGVDGRRMSGETNERFRNLGAGFTRQRRAGGDQWTFGVFGDYRHDADWGGLSATLRYDRWRTYDGVRDEYNIEDGFPGFASPDRSDIVPNRKGGEWTGRVGLERALTGAIALRGAAYKSWRLPSLNEYYRPFRVVNDITEANPNLKPETLYGVEIGADYEPLNSVKLSATYYRNWLKDGVGNVTIGFGPGVFELGGFVPEGGVLRQRANVDESVTDGVELDARLDLQTGWALTASYLNARARITKFDAMPDLVGNRPIQTPRHSVTARAAYEAMGGWSFFAEARYASSQFDDDQNSRKLDAIFTVDAGGRFDLSDAISVTMQLENLFDAKVVSAVTADGLETLARRRFWRVGLAAEF